MSYASDVVLYVPFDSDPILEAVYGQFFNEYGASPVFVPGVFGSAWQMSDDTYIDIKETVMVQYAMTIGFWLSSVNPGVVTNPSNKATLPLLMPVIAKATFMGATTITSPVWTFIIWEETQTDGTNIMKISIRGLSGVTLISSTVATSPYEVDSFHHFWIVYSGGSSPFLRIFVDTIEDLGTLISGPLPTQLSTGTAYFSVNNSVLGSSFQIARNNGIIDDLVIFNDAQTDAETIKLAANDGVPYVADQNIIGTTEVDQAAIFDDPGMAQITAIYPNRGRVYVSTSDGQILRGEKILWESRLDFTNPLEIESINVVNTAPDGTVISNNGIQITDAVVRL